jgi:hypothetical protein
MIMRLFLASLLMLVLAVPVQADLKMYTYTLFGGSNTDSLEQSSAWIPVRGAKRVYIRTWSTHAAFHVSTDADSAFSDSITTFTVLLSDSISDQVVGFNGRNIAVAADSILLPVTIAGDTARAMAGVSPLPINKVLRAPANGSGLITVVFPTRPGPGTAGQIDEEGVLAKQHLRVKVTPLRRSTAATVLATSPNRVNGLKGLRMEAVVIKEGQ